MQEKQDIIDCYHVVLAHYKAVKLECIRMSHKHQGPESMECKKLRSLMGVNDSLIETCELEIKKLEF